jgi:hypothetical protein
MKIGLLLTEEDSDKIIDLVNYTDSSVYDIIANAIDTMYEVIILQYEEEDSNDEIPF